MAGRLRKQLKNWTLYRRRTSIWTEAASLTVFSCVVQALTVLAFEGELTRTRVILLLACSYPLTLAVLFCARAIGERMIRQDAASPTVR